jgi:hypothetical protein
MAVGLDANVICLASVRGRAPMRGDRPKLECDARRVPETDWCGDRDGLSAGSNASFELIVDPSIEGFP